MPWNGRRTMSPLTRRILRELKSNIGKYLGIFLLLLTTISLVSGYLAASKSIEQILTGMRDTYMVEDGQFTTNFAIDEQIAQKIEKMGLTLYKNFSRDLPLSPAPSATGASSGSNATVRVYPVRKSCDVSAVSDGRKPQKTGEIALDRTFAEHNGIRVGDSVSVGGKEMAVVGLVTLPDYQALFESNDDFIFNDLTFCVAEISPQDFAQIAGTESYTYSFLMDNRSSSTAQRIDLEENIADILDDHDVALSSMIDSEDNNGIGYALDDVQGDQTMWETLMVMILVIIAFVFVVLTGSTIEAESAIIGTLLASGYRKRELLAHYLALPCIIGIAGAALGNVLGYTYFINWSKDLYYNSYSLPPYETAFSPDVLILTTVVPLVLLIGITATGLLYRLRRTPLQFLRHDIVRRMHNGKQRLSDKIPFGHRFRLRLFLRNLPNFLTLFFGIAFASTLLMFGICMLPVVSNYADNLAGSLASTHLYSLKAPLELSGTSAQRSSWKAVNELSAKVDLSRIDEGAVKEKLQGILEQRIQKKLQAAASRATAGGSAQVDLSACGLGIVDASSFDPSALKEADFNLSSVDFTGISKEDVGLGGVDLGGLSLKRFILLTERASSVDADGHPVNTERNSKGDIGQAEKVAIGSLQIMRAFGGNMEKVTVYGIPQDSRYWNMDVSNDRVVIGAGLAAKCNLSVGSEANFFDAYNGKGHPLTIGSTWGNSANTNVYMSLPAFNRLFGNDTDYFNGYASDKELAIDSRYLASDLTADQMARISDQMTNSMSGIQNTMIGLSVIIYFILMYLLTKTVIDRNARSISYMKVFGYRDREVNHLYTRTITIAVIASLIACLPLIAWTLTYLVKVMFMSYPGNFEIAVNGSKFIEVVALGIVSYAAVAWLHIRHIRRVPLSLALKAQE